jgi:hypothetical protein
MENKIQGDFFKEAWNTLPKTRGLIYHIPNGGKRGIIEANQFKAIGVVKGIPDIHCAIPAGGFAGLWFEFKTEGGRLSKDQEKRIETLRTAGHRVEVVRSAPEAIAILKEYLQGTNYIN